MASTKKEQEIEREIKRLAKLMESKGVTVRREKLARGHYFRVKSGACELVGQDHVFIDKRLPNEHQVSILLDAFVERGIGLENEDICDLSAQSKNILAKNLISNSIS